MAGIKWDLQGERVYETGVSKGVLYPLAAGAYTGGVAWNGLISVSESPTGAEPTPHYADNIKYLNLVSAEEFEATIEAYTYPEEFAKMDGSAEAAAGVHIGQQNRESFGLSYQTRVGTDQDSEAGYKIHLIYGALAAPTEKSYSTINDSPEAITFSWSITTTPVEMDGFKPTASITIDSRKANPEGLAALEAVLYGADAKLPLPSEVLTLIETV